MATDTGGTPFTIMAENYERVAVPAMFVPEALNLLEFAALQPGEKVLDVACGTGIVARLAAERLGPIGLVVGLDLNEAMLSVARAQPAPPGVSIQWQKGNAMVIPFPNGAFDAVLCQNGLQFMADRPLALREMRRVLRREGRLVLSVVAREAATQAMDGTVARFLGPDALALYREPFLLDRAEALESLFDGAGLHETKVSRQVVTARCPSADDFVSFTLSGRMAEAMRRLEPDQWAALIEDAHARLAPLRDGDGLVFPIDMLVAVARP